MSEKPESAPAVIVRKAIASDAEAACLVVRRSITELCVMDHGNDTVTLDAWLQNKTVKMFERLVADPGRISLVALRSGIVCGFGDMTRTGQVELLYVSPDVRFAGASTRMLEALEAEARTLGLAALTLNSSQTALPFYTARGYVAAGDPVIGIGVTRAWPMAKPLGSRPDKAAGHV